ncbi:CDP-alcohol phosphatidyltransferase family protein [Cryptosporangium phraense]|uniref:CDP-alcohol phosphatidyltransferase family protein n=1 Tax=Cryptosporangium phraense TaxID=2593070 RepID=A0A545AY17_9ACTN|nr:CDP-alcohol phosphatidyltransferase family protein [Cryptosporangium phraense]
MVAQFGVLGVLAGTVGLAPTGWLAGVAFSIATWVFLTGALHRSGAESFGPANAVTLARCTLVGGVTALVADSFTTSVHVGALVGVAFVAWLMDGIDGQVARRTGTTTALGARFDGEVDSILALVLTVYLAQSLGGWVIAIGALRYAYVVAGWALPWLRGDLPRRQSRSAIAAALGFVLVVAASGLLPVAAAGVLVGLSLGVVSWSFGRDIRFLYRRRAVSIRTASASRPFIGVGQHS